MTGGLFPTLVFPDVELWACQYLQAELAARDEPLLAVACTAGRSSASATS